jgi:DHA2 family multidrug resistance protein
VILLLTCLLLALIFAENHPLKKRLPLYQMDYPGLILLATSMLLLNYSMVNGKVEDWLESKKIVASFTGSAVTFLLFIWRELTTKHPFFNMYLFNRGNFRMGLLYFFVLAIFTPGTFQTAFSVGILHYETPTNSELGMYVIPGVLMGCFVSYFWYLKEFDEDILIFMGFLSFVVYHILMYNSFSNEFNMEKFWLPSILKGFGTAVTYISIGLHLTRNIDFTKVLGAAGAMIIVRSFIGGAISTAIYTYYSYAQRIKRFAYLAGMTDANSSSIKEHGGVLNFYKTLQDQAVLTSAKQFTGYIIIIGILLLAVLAIKYIHQKINNKIVV